MKKQILASILVGALAISSAPVWSLFGGDREKTKWKMVMKNGILFFMIISTCDIFTVIIQAGGF